MVVCSVQARGLTVRRFCRDPRFRQSSSLPPRLSLTAGEEFRFTAKAFDQNAQELSGVIFGWQSDDTAVATVDATGLVKAVSAGTAQIIASARGVHSTPAVLMVTAPSPTPITFAISEPFAVATPVQRHLLAVAYSGAASCHQRISHAGPGRSER